MKKEILAIAHLYQKVLDECDRAGAEYVKQAFREYVDAIEKDKQDKIQFLEAELCECREMLDEK